MSDTDPPNGPAGDDRVDADHPRPNRRTPRRMGQGHGDEDVGDTTPDAGLTGDDVPAGDVGAGSAADDETADVDRYRDSPGAGLLRGDEVVPEPNEPG